MVSSCKHATETVADTGDYPPAVGSIISNNCLGGGCHTGVSAVNDSLDMYAWSSLMRGSKYQYDVIPFAAAKSHLFQHINTNSTIAAEATPTMPFGRYPLSDADQQTIFNWINNGAPSASGQIAYSNPTHKLFALSEGEDMISVLDDDVRQIIRMTTINNTSTPLAPACIAMMPDKQSLIVGAVDAWGTVRTYRTTDLSSIASCQTGYYINDLALTPDGSKAYITDYPPSLLQRTGVVNTSTMTMGRTITSPLQQSPFGLAVTHDGRYIYISGAGSDNIAKVDTRNDSIIAIFPVAADVPSPIPDGYQPKYSPGFITLSPDDSRLYLSCRNSSELVVLSLTNDSVIARTPILYNPSRSVLSPDGTELWIADWGGNSIKILSTNTLSVTATVDSVNVQPASLAFSRDGEAAYVVCEQLVGGVHNHGLNGGPPNAGIYVIDRNTKKIINSFDAPGYSTQIVPGF